MKLYILFALSMLTPALFVICDYHNHYTHISHMQRQFKSNNENHPPAFYGIYKAQSMIPFP